MHLARLGFVPVLGLLPLVSFGCSDPVPPTPRGAFFAQFTSNGAACGITPHDASIGKVSDTARDQVIVDGQGDTSIDCKVSGSGSFSVSAKAVTPTTALILDIPSISPQATREKPANGNVGFLSPKTGGDTATSLEPCIFYFEPGTSEGIGAGKIWVTFECPKLGFDTHVCGLDVSYAIFENCDS